MERSCRRGRRGWSWVRLRFELTLRYDDDGNRGGEAIVSEQMRLTVYPQTNA